MGAYSSGCLFGHLPGICNSQITDMFYAIFYHRIRSTSYRWIMHDDNHSFLMNSVAHPHGVYEMLRNFREKFLWSRNPLLSSHA